jgi:leucyl-tRNA synthetase
MGPREDDPGDPGGVDLYVGGAEHAVLHLLYARFWHKVLYDLGWVSSEEPFRRLYNQGYIQAPAYTDARGFYVPAVEVVERDGDFAWEGEPVRREFGKIGKSLKNMVTPDEMYDAYGADTFRLYEMAMGPLDASRPWETRAVVGQQRFLQRLWRVVVDETTGELRVRGDPAGQETRRALHRTIAGVGEDMSGLRFNTAIAKLTELVNELTRTAAGGVPREAAEPLVLMVAPFAPHVAEELWARLGHTGSLAYEAFPVADPDLVAAETVTCVVQVGGKVRDRIDVPASVEQPELERLALESDGARRTLDGRSVRRVVVRPPSLVNIVPE